MLNLTIILTRDLKSQTPLVLSLSVHCQEHGVDVLVNVMLCFVIPYRSCVLIVVNFYRAYQQYTTKYYYVALRCFVLCEAIAIQRH